MTLDLIETLITSIYSPKHIIKNENICHLFKEIKVSTNHNSQKKNTLFQKKPNLREN